MINDNMNHQGTIKYNQFNDSKTKKTQSLTEYLVINKLKYGGAFQT